MMNDTRQMAHQLIETPPETIVDPVNAALRNAPFDDEPETEEQNRDAVEAHDWLNQNGGRGIPHAEAMRRLGLD